jgi:adenine-specific DNA-methyltransferase
MNIAQNRTEQLTIPNITNESHQGGKSVEHLKSLRIRRRFSPENDVTLYLGDCRHLLKKISRSGVKAKLVLTSPPYNIGKAYERHNMRSTAQYVEDQREIIGLCTAVLKKNGSLCWQVGNHVADGYIEPLDILLYQAFIDAGFVLRNRVIWHFEHGLNRQRSLSGRYETLLWFTRKRSDYTFNIDPIRVPQKYPAKKAYRGPRKGEYLSNPKGKNPGDVWIFPNVKQNHPEKISEHPCQFPFELVERVMLALTDPNDLVIDPFMGVGTTAVGAAFFGRRFAGAETISKYLEQADARLTALKRGQLRVRRMNTPVYEPRGRISIPPWEQFPLSLLEPRSPRSQ